MISSFPVFELEASSFLQIYSQCKDSLNYASLKSRQLLCSMHGETALSGAAIGLMEASVAAFLFMPPVFILLLYIPRNLV